MRILITGGAGFVGSHLAEAFVAGGHEVLVVDNFATGRPENVPSGAELVTGDIRESSVVAKLAGMKIDVLSHHAAQMNVRRSVTDPAYDADVNLVGSIRLLEGLVANGLRRVIFASSGGAIYGEPLTVPQSEEHVAVPVSPYGCAKLSFEHYLHYYSAVRDVRYTALRYANVYGPRQNEEGEAGVVAIFAGKLERNEPLLINGSGCQTRDFVHVDDVVRANVAVVEDRVEGTFNVGTGVETSINELARVMRALVPSSTSTLEHRPAKEGEQMRSVLDPKRLRSTIALPPPVLLAEGLPRTILELRSPKEQ